MNETISRFRSALAEARKRPLAWVAVAAAVIGCVWWLSRRNAEMPIARDARTILSAMESGDGATLYAHAFPEEIQRLGLTPDKIEQVYRRLILPRFATFHKVGEVTVQVNPDASQGVAEQNLADGAGRQWSFEATPWATQAGGRVCVLDNLVDAWALQYQIMAGKSKEPPVWMDAAIEGIRADRRTLDEIGVPGIVQNGPSHKMMDWDELIVYYTQEAANFRAKRATVPPATN